MVVARWWIGRKLHWHLEWHVLHGLSVLVLTDAELIRRWSSYLRWWTFRIVRRSILIISRSHGHLFVHGRKRTFAAASFWRLSLDKFMFFVFHTLVLHAVDIFPDIGSFFDNGFIDVKLALALIWIYTLIFNLHFCLWLFKVYDWCSLYHALSCCWLLFEIVSFVDVLYYALVLVLYVFYLFLQVLKFKVERLYLLHSSDISWLSYWLSYWGVGRV